MMSSPSEFNSRRLPERNPSPNPTSSNSEPTPQAMPNMVRNERSLCAHKVRNICRRISKNSIAVNGTPLPLVIRRCGKLGSCVVLHSYWTTKGVVTIATCDQ